MPVDLLRRLLIPIQSLLHHISDLLVAPPDYLMRQQHL